MFGNVVLDIPHHVFEEKLDHLKEKGIVCFFIGLIDIINFLLCYH